MLFRSISETFLRTDITSVKIVTVILIVAMSATTFTTQRQLMIKGMPASSLENNPMVQQQKILLYVFPIIFAVSGINFPVGVLIYWLTTNLWTMGQQFYVIKRNPTPGSPAYEEWERKQAAKAKKETQTNPTADGNPGDTLDQPVDNQRNQGQRLQPKKSKKKKK